jgi:hypothetical protein
MASSSSSSAAAAASDGVPADPSTGESLDKMLNDFDKFEGVLRNGTRQRREKDESRVAELRSIVTRVESDVAQEADRRAEAAKALQAWAETQVLSVRTRLEERLGAAHADTVRRIDALNARVTALEAKFEADRVKVLEEVDRRNRELVAALQAFHEAFEAERASRLAREQAILDRLGLAEHDALAVWDKERAEREQVYMGVKRRLEDALEARTSVDDKFQSSVFAEVAALKNGLSAEAEARESEDAALARSLQSYVAKLQASLALINSQDSGF